MNEQETAQALLPLLGGPDNVVSLAHCATRLRLVVRDAAKVDHGAITALALVKGAFSNAGQVQIVIGQGTVNRVHDALQPLLNSTAARRSKTSSAKPPLGSIRSSGWRAPCPTSSCRSSPSSWPPAC